MKINDENVYPKIFIKTLFEGEELGDVILNDDITKYSYFDVVFEKNYTYTYRVYNPVEGQKVSMLYAYSWFEIFGHPGCQIGYKAFKIHKNRLEILSHGCTNIDPATNDKAWTLCNVHSGNENAVIIKKIIGYK